MEQNWNELWDFLKSVWQSWQSFTLVQIECSSIFVGYWIMNMSLRQIVLLKLSLCFSNAVLVPVPGREEQLGAGQSGHGSELSQVSSVWPGQGQAVLLQSALHQQVLCQRPLWAKWTNFLGKSTRWEKMICCPFITLHVVNVNYIL